jgi:hypothetical protein
MQFGNLFERINKIPQTVNESELSQEFLDILKDFFELNEVEIKIHKEEKWISGRDDARIGKTFFEFKAPNKLAIKSIREEAFNQIKGYMKDFLEKNDKEPMGIITDGVTIREVIFNESDFVLIDEYQSEVTYEKEFCSIEKSDIIFYRLISGVGYRELTPENLLTDFGPNSPICKASIPALWQALDSSIDHQDKVRYFYKLWLNLFSSSVKKMVPKSGEKKKLERRIESYGLTDTDINSLKEASYFLFCVQTYYSLILKFIIIKLFCEKHVLSEDIMDTLKETPLDGLQDIEKKLKQFNFNILEEDLFSWFEKIPIDSIEGFLRLITDEILNYDVSYINKDVLKKVYQNLIPEPLRKALGEFYTKDWVADLILDQIGYDGMGKILDPACGSGTFLIRAIKKIKSSLGFISTKEENKCNYILERVVGFDINPIAVLTARLNYFLSISQLINPENIPAIPVYLCNSVDLPQYSTDIKMDVESTSSESIKSGKHTRYLKILDFEFKVPAKNTIRFLRYIENSLGKTMEIIETEIKAQFGEDYIKIYGDIIRKFYQQIQVMDREGIDGIWCKFIENYHAPIHYHDFDFVVGNPPWVSPERMDKEYRNRIVKSLKASGFLEEFKPDLPKIDKYSGTGTQYVACLPFFATTIQYFLKKGGICAFLVTSSMMKNLNSGGFRNQISKWKIKKVLDLSQETKIHEGASCWSFVPIFSKDKSNPEDEFHYYYYVPINYFKDAEHPPEFKIIDWSTQIQKICLFASIEASPWFSAPLHIIEIYRKMQSNNKNIGQIYNGGRGIVTSANKLFFTSKNLVSSTTLSMIKIIMDNGKEIDVPKSVVFPLVKKISAWKFKVDGYSVIPHTVPDCNVIPIDVISREVEFRDLYSFFLNNRRRLEARQEYGKHPDGNFYQIYRLKPEKLQSTKVAFSLIDNKISAAIIPSMINIAELGDTFIMIDHSCNFFTIESFEEAHFLCGLLNSLPLRTMANDIALPKGGKGKDGPYKQFVVWNIAILPIPTFDSSNPLHLELASISKSLMETDDLERLKVLETNLNEIVFKTYNLSSEEIQSLRTHYLMLQGASWRKKDEKLKWMGEMERDFPSEL